MFGFSKDHKLYARLDLNHSSRVAFQLFDSHLEDGNILLL